MSFAPSDPVKCYEWTRILPISEANSIMIGTSAQIQNKAENNEAWKGDVEIRGYRQFEPIQKLTCNGNNLDGPR
jgi:hypothetical protein